MLLSSLTCPARAGSMTDEATFKNLIDRVRAVFVVDFTLSLCYLYNVPDTPLL
jgi:hypothetical protein